ncbi:endolytic transglycosylase MltG [Corynebacterium sp. 153RC1]|uniref:endolytic transglycosylase MltG n=1 Tax=unclassified Corynebacterium TaxID=2624378 RepID=UPI00211BF6D7|nr:MULTISPECIES: endolytic transglycosylase MltG [unclassified Corynebacterium]MCQ9369678.1 endolytic transglycosylase MltG [Corynebacterium sp. 35RC1]MCQ9351474.1 endolytic transglycosylase MltG [Corynebacterium sp. 209RC1]MCQ9354603.1 endolytic transglycosylase MltG [Corynebacterium sp. 1222RC1]MCQ9357340.1 endolytic transglycosylase MltG [Corynebacterium sp. 122RC1]MCQ9358001.1 endolytic transglycosylase MltG [Corynebacterium sp. 142RC1]
MRMEPTYVKRRQRGLAVLITTLILVVGAVVYIGVNRSSGPADFEGQGNGVVKLVEIQEGSSISALGPELVELGVVASDAAFQTAALSNPQASSVTPGFYRLQEEMSAEAAVSALLNPENQVSMLDIPGGATLMDVTVVGGSTTPGIYSLISQVSCEESPGDCITVEQLQSVAASTNPADLGVPEWAREQVLARGDDPKRLEGLIVPGQYVVNPGADATEVLTDLVTRSATAYTNTGIVERAQALGLSPYELLTAASLVEREAPAGDFNRVARVILNRLAVPMRLEFDSTVNYGLADQEVATTDEDRATVTPWNTYAMDGLPATPIAAPSIEAIEAIENPAEGDWLFFVTIDAQGTTVFTNTFEEHQAATQDALNNGILDSNR